jgi:hypothetical protein
MLIVLFTRFVALLLVSILVRMGIFVVVVLSSSFSLLSGSRSNAMFVVVLSNLKDFEFTASFHNTPGPFFVSFFDGRYCPHP